MPDTLQRDTLHRGWTRRITWLLFRHLPEEPYPSSHPSGLRRSPPETRG